METMSDQIIEFIGPPGSGKTTLIKALLRKNKNYIHWKDAYIEGVQNAIIEAEDLVLPSFGLLKTLSRGFFQEIYPFILKFIPQQLKMYTVSCISEMTGLHTQMLMNYSYKYPDTLRYVISYLKSKTTKKDHEYILYSLVQKMVRWELYNRYYKEEKHILVDQGFVDSIHIFIPSPPKSNFIKNNIYEYIKIIPLPTQIIYLKAFPKTCISRMKNRKEGFPDLWKKLGKKQRMRRLQREINAYDVVAQKLDSKRTELIILNTEENIEKTIKKLRIYLA